MKTCNENVEACFFRYTSSAMDESVYLYMFTNNEKQWIEYDAKLDYEVGEIVLATPKDASIVKRYLPMPTASGYIEAVSVKSKTVEILTNALPESKQTNEA